MANKFTRLHDATAGAVAELDAAWFDPGDNKDKFVVTAVRNAAKAFKVIYWRVKEDGQITRIADSGNLGGKADIVHVAHVQGGGGSITAIRDADTGNLRLTNWRLIDNQVKKFVSVDAGVVKGLELANLGVIKADPAHLKATSMLITGVATETGNLKVIAWIYTNPGLSTNPLETDQGSLIRLGSGEAGGFTLLSIARLGNGPGDTQKFVTTVRDESKNLRNILWHAPEFVDEIKRVATVSAGEIWELDAMEHPFDSGFVTAVADSENRLKVIKWRNDLVRLDDFTGDKMAKISVASHSHHTILVAGQNGVNQGNLRLIALADDSAPSIPMKQVASIDAGKLGGKVKLLYMQDGLLMTAFRNSEGNLQLISWRYTTQQ